MDEFETPKIAGAIPTQEDFFIIPDAGYTPVKGGGTLGGWMSSNWDEAKGKTNLLSLLGASTIGASQYEEEAIKPPSY